MKAALSQHHCSCCRANVGCHTPHARGPSEGSRGDFHTKMTLKNKIQAAKVKETVGANKDSEWTRVTERDEIGSCKHNYGLFEGICMFGLYVTFFKGRKIHVMCIIFVCSYPYYWQSNVKNNVLLSLINHTISEILYNENIFLEWNCDFTLKK